MLYTASASYFTFGWTRFSGSGFFARVKSEKQTLSIE